MPAHELTTLLAAPVVDIDGTFFVQGAIFLGLMAILQPLLFKPWLEARARRHQRIDGAFEAAQDMRDRVALMEGRIDDRLGEVRTKTQELRNAARKQGEAERLTLVGEARRTAESTLTDERARLESEAQAARAELSNRVDEIADAVTQRLLGRSA